MDKDLFTTCFQEIEKYALLHTSTEPELLVKLRRETHLYTPMPQMLCGPLQGAFLKMISQMIQPKKVLEIGTFTGYSALCLASGLQPGGVLHTIEANPEWAEFAQKYFHDAGLDSGILQYTGDALQLIPAINGPFDLVYIDGNKEEYLDYYELIVPLIRPGGWILADNILWYGTVLEEDAMKRKDTAALIEFTRHVKHDGRVDKMLLPLEDGLLLIRVNHPTLNSK